MPVTGDVAPAGVFGHTPAACIEAVLQPSFSVGADVSFLFFVCPRYPGNNYSNYSRGNVDIHDVVLPS